MAEDFAKLSPAQQQAYLNGPALPPPAGEHSNFVDPPNRNSMAYGVISFCLVLVTLIVFLRLWGRAFCVKRLSIADFMAVAAYGLFLGYCFCCYKVLAISGFYVHQWNVKVKDLIDIAYYLHVASDTYGPSIACAKAAILLDWIQIFVPSGTRNLFFWTCQALLWINIGWYVSATIRENLSCQPHEKIWNFLIPGGHCLDNKVFELASAGVNLACDILILLLPQKIIWSLQMSVQRKISIGLIFAIGIFVCAVAGFRIKTLLNYIASDDATYTSSLVILCAAVEMLSVFLVLCVPCIPKVFAESVLFSRITSSLQSWTSSSVEKLRIRTKTGGSSHRLGSEGSKTSVSRIKTSDDGSVYRDYGNQNPLPPIQNFRSLDSHDLEAGQGYDEKQDTDGVKIVRTTKLTAKEEYGDHHLGEEERNRQHPWM